MCKYCQRNKLDGKGYGFLPECKVHSIPFEECATVQVRGNPYEFEALTVIDTVTNLVELVRMLPVFKLVMSFPDEKNDAASCSNFRSLSINI